MQLKHLKNLLPPQDGAAKIMAISWAPNTHKFAVCTADRVILLYDENGEKRDKFSTKPAESKFGKKSYVVKGMAFSPDSTKIAIGQTDNIIYVYRIGEDWKDKKVICNKFILQSAVTCLIWPTETSIVCGLADGKVRIANVKTNKSSTVYAAESYVVSLSVQASGRGFISGHANGVVIRYFFEGDMSGETQGKILTHSCPPYALASTLNGIIIGGCDKRIVAYGKDGKLIQQFDYNRDSSEREFSCAACSSSGQSVVIGSYDRLRIFNWNQRKSLWEEAKPKEIPNLYTISCLAWKKDGSKVIAGTLCGGVELFDCSLKKTIYKNKFEITYVGLSQVIVKDLSTQQKVVLKSSYGYEIDDVKVLGDERYLVAQTPKTLLLADLMTDKKSEILWSSTGGNEKFYFDNKNVCLIFNVGELTLVEYGNDKVLGSVRTEFMNPHLVSVRINERIQKGTENNKKMAYLMDIKTICVCDLAMNATLAQVSHDSKIDWLELNETGRKLLFRDKRLRLNLVDVESQKKVTILNFCAFVQWVPDSDVVIAQNRGNLCVWYNIDMPENITMFPIKGEVIDLERSNGKTEVMVKDGVTTLSYTLDESLIEFRTAIDDGNYARAIAYLESLEMTPDCKTMWSTLANLAMENNQLAVASRCFSASNDIAKCRYINNIIGLIREIEKTTGTDGYDHYTVRAKLALLDKQFKVAEMIYMEHDDIEAAISMYQQLHRWEDAIQLAEAKNYSGLENLKKNYLKWLYDTKQEDKAAELKEKEGDFSSAIELYMKCGMGAKAAQLILSSPDLSSNSDLVGSVSSSLIRMELHDKAGELYEKTKNYSKALECYKKGKAYQKAVELARVSYPRDVVPLEEEWGDYLVSQKQIEAAINHYIEAGSTLKALDAAVNARQWKKAAQIIKVIDDPSLVGKYYHLLGQHFAEAQDFINAEYFFVEGKMYSDAIHMYNKAKLWENGFNLATKFLKEDEVNKMYSDFAQLLEEQKNFEDAEKLYIILQEPDLAITMHKNNQQYDNMIKLVKRYHPDLLTDTYIHLAKQLESGGQYREAEKYYLEAKDWKSAANMYRVADLWSDAHRIAKAHGGQTAAKQVIFLWAKSLNGDAAVKLLNKNGLLDFAIDYAVENTAFDFAFTLSRIGNADRVSDIHLQYAMHLEDEGRFNEAEVEFIKAGKPKEAVLMYVHNKDWDDAQRIAEAYDAASIPEILIGQAEVAFTNNDTGLAESLLLRAQKPDIALKYYKDNGKWTDALRICKEYLPHQLQKVQNEYDKQMGAVGNSGAETVLSQAREFETAGNFANAVEVYLRLSHANTLDPNIIEKSLLKAAELSNKFLGEAKALEIAKSVGPRLIELQKFNQAAQVFIGVRMNKEAIDALAMGGNWEKAKKVAKELDPKLMSYTDEKYKDFLKNEGKADQLATVNVTAALDLHVQRGEWQKCVDLAERQSSSVLHKYLAMYAAELIHKGESIEALKLYVKHGAPANPQNFNIYAKISNDIFNLSDLNKSEAFQTWSMLRDMLYDLTQNLEKSQEVGATRKEEFETYLLISHYYATRSACLNDKSLTKIATKLSISLLRHTEIIPCDKAYYEAGIAAKNMEWENIAFVILNRYLDLTEAIEEGSLTTLDNSDFENTDIPFDVPLPDQLHVNSHLHEEIREWVLAISMDQKVEQRLPLDERETFEACLISGTTGEKSSACIISGYPVLKNGIEFKQAGKFANKEDWNKFLMTTKMNHNEDLKNVTRFISKWCGGEANFSYAFVS